MDIKINEEKLFEIFIWTDDFLKALDRLSLPAQKGQRRREPGLALSEVISILLYYHHSGYKCFEYYYERYVRSALQSHFPQAPSYCPASSNSSHVPSSPCTGWARCVV